MHPAEAYDYLVEARGRVFDRVRSLSQAQYARRQPFGWGSIRATLVHMANIEWWYTSLLEGHPTGDAPFPYVAFSRTGFRPLEAAWGELAGRTRRALASEGPWDRPIEDRWTTKRWIRSIRTTADGVAVQLLFHEVHHRAQVMAMLRRLGHPIEGVDYSLLRWQWSKEHR